MTPAREAETQARKAAIRPKNLREEMPAVAAWIDGLRDAFGADEINAFIKSGMAGVPVFFASENGRQVGTPLPAPRAEVSAADMVVCPRSGIPDAQSGILKGKTK